MTTPPIKKVARGVALVWRLWFAAVLLSASLPLRAQNGPLQEYAVKAALLFNLAKYTDWPPQAFATPAAPIVIGVLGDDPFGDMLDRVVKGRAVNGRSLVIQRASSIAELKGAHLVFISAAQPHAADDCAVLESFRILTVGDTGQTAPYTVVNLAVEGEKIVFSVDLIRAARTGVSISSKLLNLASSVNRERETNAR